MSPFLPGFGNLFVTAIRVAVAVAALLVVPCGDVAAKLQVLYDFCPKGGCTRSFSPATLLIDKAGNVYGTRDNGGTNSKGFAFRLHLDGNEWKYKTLYNFCSDANCADGASPRGGFIIDSAGNLYGTTSEGGNTNQGVFFEITAAGNYQVLYSFCPDDNTCADGAAPLGTLTYAGAETGEPYDGSSPLYGTGVASDNGIVFELTQSGGTWTSTTDYSLGEDGENCISDSVIMDASGNLFGAAQTCGSGGEAFVLGNGDTGWGEISLYSFSNNATGGDPYGPLIEDSKGRLYVAAEMGGKNMVGVIVRLSPVVNTYVPKVLHSFNVRDGSWPMGGLVADASGNFFGTTNGGGRGDGATVFELSGKNLRVLYQFCLHDNDCSHGSRPVAGVVLDSAGNVYGTTTEGGAHGFGTVFEISNSDGAVRK